MKLIQITITKIKYNKNRADKKQKKDKIQK